MASLWWRYVHLHQQSRPCRRRMRRLPARRRRRRPESPDRKLSMESGRREQSQRRPDLRPLDTNPETASVNAVSHSPSRHSPAARQDLQCPRSSPHCRAAAASSSRTSTPRADDRHWLRRGLGRAMPASPGGETPGRRSRPSQAEPPLWSKAAARSHQVPFRTSGSSEPVTSRIHVSTG